jgi:FkbM family methyltransferase
LNREKRRFRANFGSVLLFQSEIVGVNTPNHINIPHRLIRDGYIRVAGPAWRRDDGADRFSFYIPVGLLDDPSTQILLRDEYSGSGYEAQERRLLDELLPTGCLFLDIGAHWGIYSLHVLTASVDAWVVAVEPDPTNLEHLRYNLALNDRDNRATVVGAAVAAEAGAVWLRRNTAMGHHLTKDPNRAGDNALEVSAVTIDELVARFDPTGRRPVWIKLDIEGRERAALEGASAALSSGRVAGILWEVRAGGLVNPETGAITALLRGHGLITREINEDYRLSVPAGSSTSNSA